MAFISFNLSVYVVYESTCSGIHANEYVWIYACVYLHVGKRAKFTFEQDKAKNLPISEMYYSKIIKRVALGLAVQ